MTGQGRTAGRWAVGALAALLGAMPAAAKQSVVGNRHNLSAAGPGTKKAVSATMVCEFCHTPHNASPAAPSWNRQNSGATYKPYSSSTLDATVGQPTGSSKLCLSCHDGTVALGKLLSRVSPVSMRGGGFMPPGTTLLGTDLSEDHPISFVFDEVLAVQDPQLKHPGTLTGPVKLDANNELQCRSCHDPHSDEFGKFLVVANTQSALCVTCHKMTGWDFSDHKLSGATWTGTPPDPWPTTDETTVQDNACENCHQPHSAPGPERLLHALKEEDNCFPCHNGEVAADDVEADFLKLERHPVATTTGTHDPEEDPGTMSRHVECQDCHNPHAVRDGTALPPDVPPALDYVSGIDSGGMDVARASFTYEICFKCHADSLNKPGPFTPRQISQSNVRLEFAAGAVSYHPVVAAGLNPNVPSLISPLTEASLVSCTDCHGSDSSRSAGATGPDGPHGSIYAPLLERRYTMQDNVGEGPAQYALCYKCHDRSSILNDDSFKEHRKHIQGEDAPCFVCHDAHGIAAGQGTATNNSHLINFATDIVFPNDKGTLEFVDDGLFRGNCSLRCHGKDHDAKDYKP